jgi:hypothetical protein
MNPDIMFPLAGFVLVVIIVALVQLTRVHDLEAETRYKLAQEELEHTTKMKDLERELERIKRDSSSVLQGIGARRSR